MPASANLRALLEQAAVSWLDSYDPARVVAAVNALQPLGKEAALGALEDCLAAPHPPGEAQEGLFLVLRLLFEVPAPPGHMPPLLLGAPTPPPPADATRLPRFPIVLVQDLPLLVVTGYSLGGLPESVESHLRHFRQHGTIRSQPLHPVAISRDALLRGFDAAWAEAYGVQPDPAQRTLAAEQWDKWNKHAGPGR